MGKNLLNIFKNIPGKWMITEGIFYNLNNPDDKKMAENYIKKQEEFAEYGKRRSAIKP